MYNFNFGTNRYTNFNFNFGATGKKQLVIKSTVTLGYTINSINIEYLNGEDVLYVNTTGGIFKVFSPSCSGSITTKDIKSSDYCSGMCSSGIIYAGSDEDLLKIDVVSEEFESYFADGKIVEVLYYKW